MELLKLCVISLGLIQLYCVGISLADKEPRTLGEESYETENTDKGVNHFLDNHGSVTGDSDDLRDDLDLAKPQLYSYWEDVESFQFPQQGISNRQSDSTSDVRYDKWQYGNKNRKRRSINIREEESVPSMEANDPFPYERNNMDYGTFRQEIPEAPVGDYATWRQQNPEAPGGGTLYKVLSKRPSSGRRGRPGMNRWQAIWGSPGKRGRPVVNRWQSIWGSPGKRGMPYRPVVNRWQNIWGSPGKREDGAQQGWYYLDEDVSSDNDLIQAEKRPMAIGPTIDWSKFISKRVIDPAIKESYKK